MSIVRISPRIALVFASCALVAVGCRGNSDSSSDDEPSGGVAPSAGAPEKPSAPASGQSAAPDTAPSTGGEDDDKSAEPVTMAEPPAEHTFLTYNLGLLSAVGLEKERLPAIIEAMKQTRASVACLQEVWNPEDVEAITRALAGHYPHHYWHETTRDETHAPSVCKLGDALAAQRCTAEKCTPNGTSLTECVSDDALCKAEYDAFSDDCKRCLAVNVDSPAGCATGAAPRFGSGGRNGLLLLSWHEIENPGYTEFDTQLVSRGVITATIAGRTVQCTHLSADLDVVPYPGEGAYTSWANEHAAQLEVMDKAAPDGGKGCRVLMGDMNTGPVKGDMIGELEGNFPAFAKAGYKQPWDAPACTFCPDNPLSGVKQGRWIDHVFFKGCNNKAQQVYTRVFDQPIQVERDGKPVATRLSDHYGVLVETTDL